jgi:hypothetical protein
MADWLKLGTRQLAKTSSASIKPATFERGNRTGSRKLVEEFILCMASATEIMFYKNQFLFFYAGILYLSF